MRKIRIGGAGGFWGDSSAAMEQLVRKGQVDYLMYDYLAELTMAIMAKQRDRDPEAGYARDFVDLALRPVLREIVDRKIRIVTNAGGINPEACARALSRLAEEMGVELSVGVVTGDDLRAAEASLRAEDIREMWSGAPLPDKLASINAYIGAFPIAAALDAGADVVITGRAADSALALGALIHEFRWSVDDFDMLAAGSMAGHLIECGTQATGGLFTDWELVQGRADLGYPIAECFPDGTFRLTKAEGTGGLMTPLVASEQMLYEVGDPRNYLLPDVTCDLSGVTITQDGADAVLFQNIRGRAPTGTYKVTAVHPDGYRGSATLTMIGRNATKKAQTVGQAILERCRTLLRAHNFGDFTEVNVECLGSEESSFGENARDVAPREAVLRISVRHPDKRAVDLFAREIAPFGTAGTPGTTGFSGRQKPMEVYRLFSFLVAKERVSIQVTVDGKQLELVLPVPAAHHHDAASSFEPMPVDGDTVTVPLRAVAVARSGDKADVSHLAIIARDPAFFDAIVNGVTPDRMKRYLKHLVKGDVRRFDVPGISAVNFLLFEALGGGGTASLRSDALGKAFGEIALDMEIEVPKALAAHTALRVDA